MKKCEKGFTLAESLIALFLWIICLSLITSFINVQNKRMEMENEISTLYSLKEAILSTDLLVSHTFLMENSYGMFEVVVSSKEVCIYKKSEKEPKEACLIYLEK